MVYNSKMKKKFIDLYFEIVMRVSRLSTAKRLQVGSLLVNEDNILAFGYNGTPRGFDNVCETVDNVSKPEVIHAELNCILKAARSNVSCDGASMFVTHSPCLSCSTHIYQAGINKVYYIFEYRDRSGLDFLKTMNVEVVKYVE